MSTKTIAEKLQIKPNTTVWVSPPDHLGLIAPLPQGASEALGMDQATVALVFVKDESSARDTLDKHKDHLAQPDILWVAYPKANRTDINRDTLWRILTEFGMRPTGQVSVDETWSAMRFRPLKEGEIFTGRH